MTYSMFVEEVLATVEFLLREYKEGKKISVTEEIIVTYQCLTGNPNPFDKLNLVEEKIDENREVTYIYEKQLLIE